MKPRTKRIILFNMGLNILGSMSFLCAVVFLYYLDKDSLSLTLLLGGLGGIMFFIMVKPSWIRQKQELKSLKRHLPQ